VANSILTIDMITRKSLEILENNLVITRNVNRQYDDSFAVEGAKIGTALRIRLPDRTLVTTGAALQVQDDNEQKTTLTVATQNHIGVNFTSAELTMSMDDFAERVLKPRVSQLASTVDANVAGVFTSIYQAVGTPGTTPAAALVLLQGNQKLNEMAAPTSNRYATVNPAANASLVNGMTGFFNPTGTITRQFKSGMMGEGTLGYDEINMSQSIGSLTTGTRAGTTLVNGALSTQGATTLTADGFTSNTTVVVGDVFTIAGVYSVNPQTRVSTGSLQQFVVTAAQTAATADMVGMAFQPPIYTSSNALATVDSFPADNAAITFLGAAATAYPQNLIYHKDAITVATADLIMPTNVDMASRQVHNGMSLRIIRQYDINQDRMPTRIDILYGFAAIRPEMACRLIG